MAYTASESLKQSVLVLTTLQNRAKRSHTAKKMFTRLLIGFCELLIMIYQLVILLCATDKLTAGKLRNFRGQDRLKLYRYGQTSP